MSIKRWIIAALAGAVGLGLLSGCRRSAAARPEPDLPPHVVFVAVDTLRADHLSCYGYPRPTSPNLDALAGQAVRFANAFSQASWTLPSCMSMMTSQYPHVHGVADDGQALSDGATTLAEVLAAGGYDTAAIISWVYLGAQYGFNQGFDEFVELLPPEDQVDSSTTAAFKAEQVTDHAIRWLEERPHTTPCFLFVHYFDPHIDYAPPAPFDQMFDPDYRGPACGTFDWLSQYIKGLHHQPPRIAPRDLEHVIALYDGEIRYTDAHLGRLFQAIDRNLGLDNCLVIVTSDHGEELNDHGSMEGHQWTLYDEVTHVPLIVRLPQGRAAGRVVETPVESIDIPPTILGLLHAPVPPSFQGRDRGHLVGAPPPPDEPALVFGEINRFNRKQYIRNSRYKLIHTDDVGLNKRGIPVTAGYELYALEADPAEQVNLFDSNTPLAQTLIRQLEERAASSVTNVDRSQPVDVVLAPGELARLRSLGYVH